MGVACCDSSVAPPDTRMIPQKGVVAKKNPLEAGDMMMDGEMVEDEGESFYGAGTDREQQAVGTKPVLGYYGFRGLAQPIRFLLAHLGIDYTELLIENHEHWEQHKGKLGLPFPSLPCYIDEDNDVKLTGELAILKYLACKYQPTMLGRSLDDQGKIEMLAHVLQNFQKIATKPCYLQGADKQAIGENCLKEVQAFVRMFEAQGDGGKFLVGNTVSFVDFMLLE